MLHPVQEFHTDKLSAGVFYGWLIEVLAVITLWFGWYLWEPALVVAALLAVSGIGLTMWSVCRYNHEEDS